MKIPLSPQQNFWFGITLTSASFVLLFLTIRRYAWLKQKIPSLLRWGRGSFSYPASRLGIMAASFCGITMGCLFIEKGRETFPGFVLIGMLAGSVLFIITAAIHDFIIHKQNPEVAPPNKTEEIMKKLEELRKKAGGTNNRRK